MPRRQWHGTSRVARVGHKRLLGDQFCSWQYQTAARMKQIPLLDLLDAGGRSVSGSPLRPNYWLCCLQLV